MASSVHQPPAFGGTFLQTVLQCLNLGIILQISVPEVGKNWNCSLTLSDDKLYHLTIDKLGTLFLCRAPIVKHLLIGRHLLSPVGPLKTCRWGRDTIICFLAPPSVPSIMCGHKAAQQQIRICFRWSSSSHQTMPRGRVFRAVLPEPGNGAPAPCGQRGDREKGPATLCGEKEASQCSPTSSSVCPVGLCANGFIP